MRDAEQAAVRTSSIGIRQDGMEEYVPSLPAHPLPRKLSLSAPTLPLLINNCTYLFVCLFASVLLLDRKLLEDARLVSLALCCIPSAGNRDWHRVGAQGILGE